MTPRFTIRAGTDDVTTTIADRLMDLTITDNAGLEVDELQIRLDARDSVIAFPRRGVTLTVDLGFQGSPMAKMGSYVVQGVAGNGPPDTMTITAHAADMTGDIRVPRTVTWENQTFGQIVAAIAARHGLSNAVTAELANHPFASVPQTSESDLHLLTRLSADLGALAKIADGAIVVAARGQSKSITGRDMPEIPIARKTLARFAWSLGERATYDACKAWWQDRSGGTRESVLIGTSGRTFELRRVFPDATLARRAARSKLDDLKRGRATFEGALSTANLDLTSESPVIVSGVLPVIDGRWIVTQVQHRIENNGLISRFRAEIPQGDPRLDNPEAAA